MVHTLGGKVRPADKREYGHAEIDVVSDSLLFQGLAKKLAVWMSHGDEALELPPGFELMREPQNGSRREPVRPESSSSSSSVSLRRRALAP